jgi:hypothetical protein
MKEISSEEIKEGLIQAGVLEAITQDKDLLKSYMEQAQSFDDKLVSTLGEGGANAFDYSSKTFSFKGTKLSDYLALPELSDEDFQQHFEELGFESAEAFEKA